MGNNFVLSVSALPAWLTILLPRQKHRTLCVLYAYHRVLVEAAELLFVDDLLGGAAEVFALIKQE